jgi:hypothetical protein
MASIRVWHMYLGFLIAPSVLFFALTGALQLFGLTEPHGDYRPAVFMQKLSSVHEDQVFAPPPTGEHHESDDEVLSTGTVLLKWYFLAVAVALSLSTLLGLWIGFKQGRRPRTCCGLLLLGAIVPAVLTVI